MFCYNVFIFLIKMYSNCKIVLNTGLSGVFYTGDTVTGSVHIEIKNKEKLKYINFQVIGISQAQWVRSSPTVPYIKVHSEKIKILDIKFNILENNYGKIIQPGMQSECFQFILPEDLPSTFQSSIAKVKYCIKVKCKTSNKFEKETMVPFTVFGRINLNHIESFLTPFYCDFHRKFGKSDEMLFCLKTYKGFSPTQKIPFEITISNEKKRNITKIKISLIQKLEYNISSGYAIEEIVIEKTEYKIKSKEKRKLCRMDMLIPYAVPSSINQTNPMIDISYVLRVEVGLLFHFSIYEDIPVTVASEPVIHYDIEQIKDLQIS